MLLALLVTILSIGFVGSTPLYSITYRVHIAARSDKCGLKSSRGVIKLPRSTQYKGRSSTTGITTPMIVYRTRPVSPILN